MTKPHGFPGQILRVIPRPRVLQALNELGTEHLVVTDCGHFPRAHAHARRREVGIDQAIIIVCAGGQGWCELDGARRDVQTGQLLVIPPGVPHAYGADDDDPWTVWWLHVAGRDVADFVALSRAHEVPVRTLTDTYRAIALIEEVTDLIGAGMGASRLLSASGAAWHLLAMLSVDQRPRSSKSELIDNARDFLRHHVDSRVSVADLAAAAGMSPSHFAFLFKQHVGIPVLKYQTDTRMARARELLDMTDHSVAMVAGMVGFDDPFYFSRQFKSKHGMTPMQYRRLDKG